MILINGSQFINSLRTLGLSIKTQTKLASSLLSNLNSITNTGMHSSEAQMIFQNRSHGKTPARQQRLATEPRPLHHSDRYPTGKEAHPLQPAMNQKAVLKPTPRGVQLPPETTAVKKSTLNLPTRMSRAPLPALSPALIVQLEQTIKYEQQTPDSTEWRPQKIRQALPAKKLRRAPLPPLSKEMVEKLVPEIKTEKLRGNSNEWRPHLMRPTADAKKTPRVQLAPQSPLMAPISSTRSATDSIPIQSREVSKSNRVEKRPRNPLPPLSEALITKLVQTINDDKQSADRAVRHTPDHRRVGSLPKKARSPLPLLSDALMKQPEQPIRQHKQHSDGLTLRPAKLSTSQQSGKTTLLPAVAHRDMLTELTLAIKAKRSR